MSGVKISNIDIDAVALPFPMVGYLGGRDTIILNKTKAQMMALIPQQGMPACLAFEDLPNYIGPYDDAVFKPTNLQADGAVLSGLGAGVNPGDAATMAQGIQHVTVLIPLATIQAQASGVAFNVGSVLPANARLIDYSMNVTTPISGGAIASATASLQGGTDPAGTLIAAHSVFTGANPLNSPIGSNPYPSRGGQQLKVTLTTTGGALSTATAGALVLEYFYVVVA